MNQNLTIDAIDFNTELGEGTLGIVYPTFDGKYVFKDYKRSSESYDECYLSTINSEISIMKSLDHAPFIMKVENVIFNEDHNGFFMKRCDLSIWDYLKNYGPIEKHLAKKFFFQLLIGLCHAHDIYVIHGDIKPDNIMLDKENVLLSDWGHSVFMASNPGETKTLKVQTLPYRAPEILLGDTDYTGKIDIWSAALVYIEMIKGKRFFNEISENAQLRKIFQVLHNNWNDIKYLPNYHLVKNLQGGSMLVISDDPLENDLINKMLSINPDERLDITDCITHPFFQDFEIDEIVLSDIEKLSLTKHLYRSPKNSIIKNWIIDNTPSSYINTIFLALAYFDYISPIADDYLYAGACIYLASSINDKYTIKIKTIEKLVGHTPEEICSVANEIYRMLDYNLYITTPIMISGIVTKNYGRSYNGIKQTNKLMLDLVYKDVVSINGNEIDDIIFSIVCSVYINNVDTFDLFETLGFYDDNEELKLKALALFDIISEYKKSLLNNLL